MDPWNVERGGHGTKETGMNNVEEKRGEKKPSAGPFLVVLWRKEPNMVNRLRVSERRDFGL